MNDKAAPTRRFSEMPDAYIIIFCVVALAAILTYVVPAGQFTTREIAYEDREGVTRTREVLDPDTFQISRNAEGEAIYVNVSLFAGEADLGDRVIHRFPSDAQGDLGFFNYLFAGLTSGNKYGAAVGVVAFILIIGGAFGILMRTGVIEDGLLVFVKRAKGSDHVLIPVLFLLFSLGGAIFGMSEEAIAFAMLIVPIMVGLGYDSITGVLITYVATQIGFATSWMNPFNVGIAQGLAGIPILSGLEYRAILWAIFTGGMLVFVVLYARHIKRHPERSLTWKSDDHFRNKKTDTEIQVRFTRAQAAILGVLFLGIIWVIWGVVAYQYYIPEIATQFFVIGLLSGIIGVAFGVRGMKMNDLATSFRKGASELLGAALIVGMAKAIILVLGGDDPTEPSVLNTILHAAGTVLAPVNEAISAQGMLLFQSLLNFFVPSGTGQAALTMPLMAPLADLAGLERQVAVLAFQLGDGLTNLIIPTSAALMGTLAVARIDFLVWFRFMLRIQIVLAIGAMLALAIAVWMGFR